MLLLLIMGKRILEILACPLCKGKLHYDRSAQELICRFDKLAYPIIDGIPIMIADKARNLLNNNIHDKESRQQNE